MGKYIVEVNDNSYNINITKVCDNPGQESSQEACPSQDSAQMTMDAIRAEYDHCIARAEKLDNKIYILLTVCAFVFAFSTDIIMQMRDFAEPESVRQICMLVFYMILLAMMLFLFIYLLWKLIRMLKGMQIKRLDPDDLFRGDLFNEHPKTTARTIGLIYLDALTENNAKLEERFQEYNKCSGILLVIIVLAILTALLGNFL